MARFPLGSPVRVSWLTRDPGGTLVNATANSLTVKLANADGTSTATAGSPYTSPINDSTGAYHQDVGATDLATAGHYQWVATSTGTGAGAAFGDFDVFDPFEPAVLPLADGKDALNIPQATTTYDSEIGAYIATITQSLERLTGGPLVNRTITAERCEMTTEQSVILVRQRPVVSVTTIVAEASGTAIDISTGVDIDPVAGTIRRKLTGWPFILPVFIWQPVVLVTYVAGWGTVMPAAFNTFGRIVLQHLWASQHGPSARPSMAGEIATVQLPGWGFAIPNQAAELLNGGLNGLPFLQEAYV